MKVPIEELDLPTLKSLARGTKTSARTTHQFVSDEFGALADHIARATTRDCGLIAAFIGTWRKSAPVKNSKPPRKRSLRGQPGKTAPISTLGDNESAPMARRIVNASGIVTTGMFPSFKMKNNMPWEGINEYASMLNFEVDPNVIGFFPQPKWLTVPVSDGLRDHCPDFLVTTRNNGNWFVETKSDRAMKDEKFEERTDAVARFLANEGYGYFVLAGSAARSEPRLYNAELLYHHMDDDVHPDAADAIFNILKGGSRSIRELASSASMDLPECFCAMLWLHLQGSIILDWTDRFHYDSYAKLPNMEIGQ